MKTRVAHIVQYEYNPRTGEDLHFGEDNIKRGVAHKSIKQYAYIRHDKDVYTEVEDAKGIGTAGEPRPEHWHIVIRCDNAVEIETLAKWFGVPANQIDVPKGHGAFWDCVSYLTHEAEKEQAQGKHRYDDAEVIANFDWRQDLDERETNRIKYGRDLSRKDQFRYGVLFDGKTLRDCWEEDRHNYQNDFEKLKKCRHDYLVNRAALPSLRINIYIDGPGGIGKNTVSKAIAKALYQNMDMPYFEVGGDKVSFDRYDGEPVIIWNDFRACDLIYRWGRGEVFDLLDSHPTSGTHHIKYGDVRLVNAVNIINGIEPFKDFLDGLAGEYTDKNGTEHEAEDKSQAYRRIPIIICVREEHFDCLLNQGVACNTREYDQYIGYRNITGSFSQIAQRLDGAAKDKVLIRMTKPVVDCVDRLKSKEQDKIIDADAIPEDFDDYGKVGTTIDYVQLVV